MLKRCGYFVRSTTFVSPEGAKVKRESGIFVSYFADTIRSVTEPSVGLVIAICWNR